MWQNGHFLQPNSGPYYPEWELAYGPIHGFGRPIPRPHMRDDFILPQYPYPTPYARGSLPVLRRHPVMLQRPPLMIPQIMPQRVNAAAFLVHERDDGQPPPRPAGISGPSDKPSAGPAFETKPTNAANSMQIVERAEKWKTAKTELEKVSTISQIAGSYFKDFSASNPTPVIPLELSYKVSSSQADICWKTPPGFLHGAKNYEIEAIIEGGLRPQKLKLPVWKTCMSMKLVAGTWYTVRIVILDEGKTFASGNTSFKAIFDLKEMKVLYEKAVKQFGDQVGYRFTVFHRAKPQEYWDDIWYHRSRVMEKYDKDQNGQPASPINGAIKGLFFSANLKNGVLPQTSFFGELRMTIPSVQLLPLENNLYFADFYCNRLSHYVTVVITVPGSATDLYCKQCLIQLPIDRNPFLKAFRGVNSTEYWVHSNNLWVEVFYTEDIPLHWGEFSPVTPAGPGRSKPGGLPNNKFCTICNLYPLGVKAVEKVSEAGNPDEEKPDSNQQLREQLRKLDETLTVDLTGDEEIEEYTIKDDNSLTSEPNSPLPKQTENFADVSASSVEDLDLQRRSDTDNDVHTHVIDDKDIEIVNIPHGDAASSREPEIIQVDDSDSNHSEDDYTAVRDSLEQIICTVSGEPSTSYQSSKITVESDKNSNSRAIDMPNVVGDSVDDSEGIREAKPLPTICNDKADVIKDDLTPKIDTNIKDKESEICKGSSPAETTQPPMQPLPVVSTVLSPSVSTVLSPSVSTVLPPSVNRKRKMSGDVKKATGVPSRRRYYES